MHKSVPIKIKKRISKRAFNNITIAIYLHMWYCVYLNTNL